MGCKQPIHLLISLVLLLGVELSPVPAMAQGIVFQAASLPRQVRGEGITETVGEISLQNTTPGGSIPAGSSIAVEYGAPVANAPGLANVTCVIAGVPGACPGALAVAALGNKLILSFMTNTGALAVGDAFVISQVRVSAPGAGKATVSATLSGASALPATNPITFTQVSIPVASVVSPSVFATYPSTATGTVGNPLCLPTCVSGAGDLFHVAITERFPAALTTAAQEASFSSTPAPAIGTQIRVRIIGIPKGFQVSANAPAAPVAPSLLSLALPEPFPVRVISSSEDIFFTYTVTASNPALVETIVLPFAVGLPTGVTSVSLRETVVVTAEVGLAPVGGTSLVRFAPNVLTMENDFSLSVAPSSLVVAAGKSATYSVSVSSIGSFAASVFLLCNGLPDGAECNFSPNPAAPGTTTVTVTTSTFMPAGTVNFRVVGVSGFSARSANGSLTIGPPQSGTPLFTPASVVNAASLGPGLSPGALATIFGTSLTKDVSGIVRADNLPLPTQLRGTSVTVSGLAAPLLSIANVNGQEQINLQVPYELTGRTSALVVVSNNGLSSSPVPVTIFPAQPGIFTLEGTTGAILHGSDFQPVSASMPAARGEVVILYATGLGPVSQGPLTGLPALSFPLSTTILSLTVTVSGVQAEVLFSGLAPGFVGLYQVNIRVPESVPSGNLDVVIQVDGRGSKAVKMAVQ